MRPSSLLWTPWIWIGTACLCIMVVGINGEAVEVHLKDAVVTVGNRSYVGHKMEGTGTNWKSIYGVYGYVIPKDEHFDVTYVNDLSGDRPSIIHAHGQTPPFDLDGVPNLPNAAMAPGIQAHYKYDLKAVNRGTYWLHSHFGFQYGRGLAAPMIIKDDHPTHPLHQFLEQSTDVVMMLQDICPYAPGDDDTSRTFGHSCNHDEVLDALLASYEEGVRTGELPFYCPGIEPATDHDVIYEDYLVNGKNIEEMQTVTVDALTSIRLRVINAAGMTHFQVRVPHTLGPMIVSSDGQMTYPYSPDNSSFWVAVAQRIDVLLFFPQEGIFHVMVVGEGTDGRQSGMTFRVGETGGNSQPPVLADPPAGSMSVQTEAGLRAFYPLEERPVDRVLVVNLTGDNGFKGVNNKSFRLVPHVDDFSPNQYPLLVREGERVHMEINNFNPDSHAMHLHGHTFQVISIDGVQQSGAIRDTVLVPGGCHQVVIAFNADNPGKWLFHCHMEFHMAAGMITTLEYEDTNGSSTFRKGGLIALVTASAAGIVAITVVGAIGIRRVWQKKKNTKSFTSFMDGQSSDGSLELQ